MTRPPHLCPHCATAAARRWQPRCCPQPSGSGSFLAPPSPPDPGGCGAAALTDVGVAESVLRMDGDASASLHHQVPQAPAAQEHDEEAQPRRHVAPEVPSHFCGAGGGRCCVRLTLFLLSSSLCAAAACRAAVSVAASLGGTARSWGELRRGALRTERDRRAELYPARAARALEAPPRAANGSAALPHRRERGAGLSPPRLIGNRAGARWAGARSRFWLRPRLRPRSWFWLRPDRTRSAPGTAGWGKPRFVPAVPPFYRPVTASPEPPRAASQGTWKTDAGLAVRLESSRCFPSIHPGCLRTEFKL